MTQPDPNEALSQNFMMLGLLVASENANTQTNTQTDRKDSCFISIDYNRSFDTNKHLNNNFTWWHSENHGRLKNQASLGSSVSNLGVTKLVSDPHQVL